MEDGPLWPVLVDCVYIVPQAALRVNSGCHGIAPFVGLCYARRAWEGNLREEEDDIVDVEGECRQTRSCTASHYGYAPCGLEERPRALGLAYVGFYFVEAPVRRSLKRGHLFVEIANLFAEYLLATYHTVDSTVGFVYSLGRVGKAVGNTFSDVVYAGIQPLHGGQHVADRGTCVVVALSRLLHCHNTLSVADEC